MSRQRKPDMRARNPTDERDAVGCSGMNGLDGYSMDTDGYSLILEGWMDTYEEIERFGKSPSCLPDCLYFISNKQ